MEGELGSVKRAIDELNKKFDAITCLLSDQIGMENHQRQWKMTHALDRRVVEVSHASWGPYGLPPLETRDAGVRWRKYKWVDT